MKIIEQSYKNLSLPENPLQMIEQAGRVCYKSEDKITPDSSEKFVKMLRDKGHHAMLEFADITVRLITDRGVSHELVRHRLFSFAQESTRYVKYNGEIEFIKPVWCSKRIIGIWPDKNQFPTIDIPQTDYDFLFCCAMIESYYKSLLNNGWRPEQARAVLPNSLKTEIIVKGNLRQWRHFFNLRTSPKAHPNMRHIANLLLKEFKKDFPVFFEDINQT